MPLQFGLRSSARRDARRRHNSVVERRLTTKRARPAPEKARHLFMQPDAFPPPPPPPPPQQQQQQQQRGGRRQCGLK